MPRKEPRTPDDFAFDFLADWRELVPDAAARTLPDGWTLHGTVTKDGVTYALAWSRGMTAAWDGRVLDPLTAIERSSVSLAVEFKQTPGWETVPKRPPPADGYPFVR